MANFKLGCNFDLSLIDRVSQLNYQYSKRARINEFYGSDRRMAYLTARPDFRLPEISKQYFEKYIERCNENSIDFNYTMNTINPGSKGFLIEKKNEIMDFVRYLESIGVRRVTIANPVLMEIVRETTSTLGIDVSTVFHIDAISQAKFLKEKYNVEKICCNLIKTRHIRFLKNLAKYCNNNNIMLEHMVNEFCGVSGENYSTHCVYRDSCYLFHASDKTKEDAAGLDGYPMSRCIFHRNETPANWLRMRFIRPEDIDKYVNIGINNFKITGRTGTTDYLAYVAEGYMLGKWNDNLLTLWKPLETIQSDLNELEFKQKFYIDNSKLNGFVYHWFDNPDFDCSLEECGLTCDYCQRFYELVMK